MSFVGVAWDWYARNREVLTALGALLGGGLLTWGALQQPAFAACRLKERHDTNRPPGTTEVFSKAIGQLQSNKPQICLGGIFALERIACESRHDHYVVMEVLAAFVRERARWSGQDGVPSAAAVRDPRSSRRELPKDAAAALATIIRRETADQTCKSARIDLSGTNLGGVQLPHAPLRKANLSGANLAGANLVSANLSGANLSRTALQGASLVGASLARATLNGADLNAADLRGADLHEADLSWADLKDANLYGADLKGAVVTDARLGGASLHGANLHQANLSGSDLREAQLSLANLGSATLRQANLGKANLSRSNLSEASLYEFDLSEADLRGADLTRADLSWADLRHALLSWADLRGAVLYGANLSGADLSGADLRNADIRAADLSGANLTDAVLHGTILQKIRCDVAEAGNEAEPEPGETAGAKNEAGAAPPDGADAGVDAIKADEADVPPADTPGLAQDRDSATVHDLVSGCLLVFGSTEPGRPPSDVLVAAGAGRPDWPAAAWARSDHPPARVAGPL